jgi:peptide/nickel transport system substrate-binding protein
MTMIVRYEVTDLASKIPGSSSPVVTKRLLNGELALIDGQGSPRPYLAESLPQLNTESWRVFPDGRMETTYRLRPGLTWHDGQPLTADDFAFALQIYTNRAFSIFIEEPQDRIERVQAPDPQTVFIEWKRIYPNAGALTFSQFDPLPRHILERSLASIEDGSLAADAFVNLPFWTQEYVGAGPYKLERWTPGSHLDLVAFPGYALGRPKIDRILLRIVSDENTTLSTVLSGNADFTADFTLRFEHAMVLKREWEAAGKGTVVLKASSSVQQILQQRPEYVMHPGQLDARVRRALAQTIDRQALNDGLFEGQGISTDNILSPSVPYFQEVDRVIAKYPYDPRRAEQYMAETGFTKDREGFFATPSGDQFRTDVKVTAGPEFERGQAILVDTWRRVGFQVSSSVLPAAQARDREARQTFPGMASRGGGLSERSMTTEDIGNAANRWTGDNRGGWSNPEYDRVYDGFTSTLDRAERTRHVVQMMKILSEELPLYGMYLSQQVNTQSAGLRGPDPGAAGFGTLTEGTLPYWNIHEWEIR